MEAHGREEIEAQAGTWNSQKVSTDFDELRVRFLCLCSDPGGYHDR
jgi:hypothetical protein